MSAPSQRKPAHNHNILVENLTKVMLNVDKQKLAILKPTGPQTSHHLPRAIFNYVAYGKDASYPEVLLQGLLAKSMD